MKKREKVYRVPSLERAFDILDLIRSSAYGRSAAELSQLLTLPYSTTFYLLKTMERHGFLRRNGDNKRFFLGTKLITYQANIAHSLDIQIRDVASSYLDQIVNEFKVTGHTAIRDGDEAVYIDRKEPPNSYIKINSWIGQRVPLHCTAVGKSLLLLSEAKEIAEILHSDPLTRFTDRTILEIKALTKHLQGCRKLGYTFDDREAELEGACVASPIIDRREAVVAAVGVSATIYQLPPTKMHEMGENLNRIGQEISQRLGFNGEYPGSI